jgi:ADP-ribosylglycohydrolase
MDPKASAAVAGASKNNQDSMSNGSLMRCTPLAVFTSKLPSPLNVKDTIIADVEMTHPNINVKNAIVIYVSTIHFLLNNHTDENRAKLAFEKAYHMASDI